MRNWNKGLLDELKEQTDKEQKARKPFFFKWQKWVIYFLGGGLGISAKIASPHSGLYNLYGFFGFVLDLILTVSFSIFIVFIPMAIGQGIYKAIIKRKIT